MAIYNAKKFLFDESLLDILSASVLDPTPKRLKSRVDAYIEDNTFEVYAYKSDDKNIGIIIFNISNDICVIHDFAVKKDSRAKGIGSKLVDYVVENFKPKKIIAETDNNSVGFYEKYGFTITEISKTYDDAKYLCVLQVN